MKFVKTSVSSPDAAMLLEELNETLITIIGNNGTGHVNYDEFEKERAAFIVGYDGETPVCCAGLRPFDADTAEVKRVFARRNGIGAGKQLLTEIERVAAEYRYRRIILECRTGNAHAIEFYIRNGYAICENYPPYVGVEDAVCLEKRL